MREDRYMAITRVFFTTCFLSIAVAHLVARTEVLFSPDDQPTEKLTSLIKNAQKKIYAAVYMITDKKIVNELIRAKKRGVDVKIVIDASSMDSVFGKGAMLKENNIDLYVFRPQIKRRGKHQFASALMHNKFALIDDHLWTGSFNWTKRANKENQENVIVTTDTEIYAKFEQHFHILKNRCEQVCIAFSEPIKQEKSLWQDFFDQFTQQVIFAYEFVKNHVMFLFSDA
jgi:phosphatidylserine/phosphatidylglycerophosphate/cardiolipin synthase-like enzyme